MKEKFSKELKDPKYVVCLFKMEGHKTFRILTEATVEAIEKHLKNNIGKNKVTARKFFEIDRLTGSFEEF